jgi:hypothetical protein
MRAIGVRNLLVAAAVLIGSLGAAHPAQAQNVTLTITTTGSNPGTVAIIPLGQLCSPVGGGTCEFPDIPTGTQVRLLANSPTTPGVFSSVGGSAAGCASGTSTCTFVITEDSAATLAFNAGVFPSVTVNLTGGGPGEVGVDNNRCQDIDPGFSACTTYYGSGSVVTMGATAPESSAFAGFFNGTGDAAGCATTPCSFTLNSSITIDAKFTPCKITPSVFNGNLSLNFNLGTVTPATWNVFLSIQNSTVRLWSLPLPAIDPAIQFSINVPGFPAVGKIGVLTTLVGPSGIACSSWRTVNSGT